MIKAAYLLNRFADLLAGRLVFGAIAYGKNKANFAAMRNAKILLHFLLDIEPEHAGGEPQLECLVAHIESGHGNISLRKSLGIAVMVDHFGHYFGRLLYKNNESRNLIAEGSACCAAFKKKCVAEFLLRFRIVNNNESPWLCIASAGRKTPCFYELHQVVSGNRTI